MVVEFLLLGLLLDWLQLLLAFVEQIFEVSSLSPRAGLVNNKLFNLGKRYVALIISACPKFHNLERVVVSGHLIVRLRVLDDVLPVSVHLVMHRLVLSTKLMFKCFCDIKSFVLIHYREADVFIRHLQGRIAFHLLLRGLLAPETCTDAALALAQFQIALRVPSDDLVILKHVIAAFHSASLFLVVLYTQ